MAGTSGCHWSLTCLGFEKSPGPCSPVSCPASTSASGVPCESNLQCREPWPLKAGVTPAGLSVESGEHWGAGGHLDIVGSACHLSTREVGAGG